MVRGSISVVIGLVLIVGGLSGKLVMRGTDSGLALAVAGFVVAGIGVWRIVSAKKSGG